MALVGTYPPTHCGLATFTSNLRAAIADSPSGWEAGVVRVLDDEASLTTLLDHLEQHPCPEESHRMPPMGEVGLV